MSAGTLKGACALCGWPLSVKSPDCAKHEPTPPPTKPERGQAELWLILVSLVVFMFLCCVFAFVEERDERAREHEIRLLQMRAVAADAGAEPGACR